MSVRVTNKDAHLFRERVAASGGEAGEYFTALLRSRNVPERDVRDLGRLTSTIAALNDVVLKLQAVRGEVARGFGLVKQTFIAAPKAAMRAQAELDRASAEARAVIARADRTILTIEACLSEPVKELRAVIQDLRRGDL